MSAYWELLLTKWRWTPRGLSHTSWVAIHLDGAVKQGCVHRTTTLQELDDLLSAYDMKRGLVEINYKATQ